MFVPPCILHSFHYASNHIQVISNNHILGFSNKYPPIPSIVFIDHWVLGGKYDGMFVPPCVLKIVHCASHGIRIIPNNHMQGF